jgi:hypothetical protein
MGGLPNSTYSFTQTYSQIGFIWIYSIQEGASS